MQALALRRSTRSLSPKQLPSQQLSDLLWAAFGVNRENGGRTAPSAWNWQEIDVYLTTAAGAFVYLPSSHSLKRVVADDLRDATGVFEFVKTAPVNLVYVADHAKLAGSPEPADKRTVFTAADAAFIVRNAYLYCASEGLATVVFAGTDKELLAKVLRLRDEQRIVLAQSVGYPAKAR